MNFYFTQIEPPDPALVAELTRSGWCCLHLPFRETVLLEVALPDLNQFDYVVLTSKNAARWLKARSSPGQVPPIIAVGGSTAALVEGYTLAEGFLSGNAETMVARMRQGLRPGSRILFLRGASSLGVVSEQLYGFAVESVTVYKTRKIQNNHPIYSSGMVYFQAPSTVTDFSETYRLPPTRVGAIGPTTAKAITRLGWPIDFQPERPELRFLAKALPSPEFFDLDPYLQEDALMSRSEILYAEAVKLMPAGVNSPVRAFRSVGGTPLFMESGKGSYMTDVDGNQYLDFCGSWGPLILGHRHPHVQQAIEKVVARGWTFGTPVPEEVALAGLVVEKLAGVDMVRFVNSGTEAVMSAIRLARGFTGRNKILKFRGCYHGHVDYLLVDAGSGLATFGTASSEGVPEDFARLTATMPLNDVQALEQLFQQMGSELACVIIEGVPANNGLLIQDQGYIHLLAGLCRENGTLLIFDEVLSGFRMPEIMAYEHYGVEPDLVVLGKVIGGGLPVGAYGGRHEIMQKISPLGGVYQAGTLSGNPVAMAAGFATLQTYYQEDVPGQIATLGCHLDQGMANLTNNLEQMGFTRIGSLFWLFFHAAQAPKRAEDISSHGAAVYKGLHRFMLDRGIYLAPSSYEVGFLNSAMTTQDIDRFLNALEDAKKEKVIS